MKEFLVGYLGAQGYEVLDFGTDSPESVDYPDYAHPLAEASSRVRCPSASHSAARASACPSRSTSIRASAPVWPGLPNRGTHPPPQQRQHRGASGPLHHQRRGRSHPRRLLLGRVRRGTPPAPHRQDSRSEAGAVIPPRPKANEKADDPHGRSSAFFIATERSLDSASVCRVRPPQRIVSRWRNSPSSSGKSGAGSSKSPKTAEPLPDIEA